MFVLGVKMHEWQVEMHWFLYAVSSEGWCVFVAFGRNARSRGNCARSAKGNARSSRVCARSAKGNARSSRVCARSTGNARFPKICAHSIKLNARSPRNYARLPPEKKSVPPRHAHQLIIPTLVANLSHNFC